MGGWSADSCLWGEHCNLKWVGELGMSEGVIQVEVGVGGGE